jgi:transposase
VLRFRVMIDVVWVEQPQASWEERKHGTLCRIGRVGLEAGPLSQWLFSGLAEAGAPAICSETRRAKAFLEAQVNKGDRNDARGIAQTMRVGLFRPGHVKTLASQKRRALLAARKILQEKALAIANAILD